ncbi:hypothetical protein L0668_18860 [Paraglaciecola aquimarina]|uniref:CBU-0592-like domain-containing protein n=1 Tax=Paraglaciecola algarum TaxID=3050085 RepID=A0ABS9DB47_9ALTE|nr:hypothetical protein [Paraglaciecola sp. G1-23]MCF2950180.1 hypothetical protein [Paraglaciecola sp. G1-23]
MIFTFLGWFGTISYLLNHAYISLIQQRNDTIYYGGNLLAASALVISSIASNSIQAAVINGFWAIISILILIKVDLNRLPFSRRIFRLILLCFACALLYQAYTTKGLDIELLGWSSAFVFSASYLLFSVGKMQILNYLICNTYAAFAILPQVWVDQNWPVFGLEICWGCISIYGVTRKYSEIHLID